MVILARDVEHVGEGFNFIHGHMVGLEQVMRELAILEMSIVM